MDCPTRRQKAKQPCLARSLVGAFGLIINGRFEVIIEGLKSHL